MTFFSTCFRRSLCIRYFGYKDSELYILESSSLFSKLDELKEQYNLILSLDRVSYVFIESIIFQSIFISIYFVFPNPTSIVFMATHFIQFWRDLIEIVLHKKTKKLRVQHTRKAWPRAHTLAITHHKEDLKD